MTTTSKATTAPVPVFGSVPLYEAVNQLRDVLAELEARSDEIEAAGGVIPDDLDDRLTRAIEVQDDRIEAVALAVGHIEERAEYAKQESARLAELAKQTARSADHLKSYLVDQLHRAGLRRADTRRRKVWLQTNGTPSIRPEDPDAIDPRFLRFRVEGVFTAETDPSGFLVSTMEGAGLKVTPEMDWKPALNHVREQMEKHKLKGPGEWTLPDGWLRVKVGETLRIQ